MKKGDENAIYKCLASSSYFAKARAILAVVEYELVSQQIEEMLVSLKEDNERVFAANPDSTISNFSKAALDILGIEKYDGNDEYVKDLISQRLGV